MVDVTPPAKTEVSVPKPKVASAPPTDAVSTNLNEHAIDPENTRVQSLETPPTNGTESHTTGTDPILGTEGGSINTGTGTGADPKGTGVGEAEKAPDVMPSLANLPDFLRNNIHYPFRAKEEGVSGKVWVNFIIDEEGKILSAQILQGAGYGFDEEALRVIKLMPKWKPGMKNGKPVKVSFTQPITFSMQ